MALRNSGYNGPRKQGGWIGAAIGAVVSLYGQSKARKAQKKASQQVAASDPYGPYRAEAAARLKALQDNPSSIFGTAEYKSRQTAAERLIASQGYTGSGNAVAAAAEAGGQSYQQAFSNLAMLAGAGFQPGGSSAALANYGNASDSYLSSIAGVANNAVNLANTIWNRPANNTSNTGNTSGGTGSTYPASWFGSGWGPDH